ncbi:eukaryotic translation initiation factor 3 subunit A isoform X4 [Gallus gallus]|uniref:eukaryotic translation initiation factor 3 subunit A isoform X4 n=1 Tax=Gallus gallus TaxID=9031 RepID=UPI001EFFF129|nr:eukaryotic translation initiation factor 3 subunit A isoform X4 [Gallus gallus]
MRGGVTERRSAPIAIRRGVTWKQAPKNSRANDERRPGDRAERSGGGEEEVNGQRRAGPRGPVGGEGGGGLGGDTSGKAERPSPAREQLPSDLLHSTHELWPYTEEDSSNALGDTTQNWKRSMDLPEGQFAAFLVCGGTGPVLTVVTPT